jgi:hypothetical protein
MQAADPITSELPTCNTLKEVKELARIDSSGMALNVDRVNFWYWKVKDADGQAAKHLKQGMFGHSSVFLRDKTSTQCTWRAFHTNSKKSRWVIMVYPAEFFAKIPVRYETVRGVFDFLYQSDLPRSPLPFVLDDSVPAIREYHDVIWHDWEPV